MIYSFLLILCSDVVLDVRTSNTTRSFGTMNEGFFIAQDLKGNQYKNFEAIVAAFRYRTC